MQVFASRTNSMGQYRPITWPLWGIPQWLGFFDPAVFHGVTVLLLLLASTCLARLHFLYFRQLSMALWAGLLYFALPTHDKPLYWIAAWHNTAAGLFVLAACVSRVEAARNARHDGGWRLLSLFCFYLAIASRELAFAMIPVLLAIDFHERKTLRRSWEIVLLGAGMFVYLFLIVSPLKRAAVSLESQTLPGAVSDFWSYGVAQWWNFGDGLAPVKLIWPNALAALVVLASLTGPLLRRPLALGSMFFYLGIAPFLLIGAKDSTYAVIMGAGVAFLLSGLAAMFRERLPKLLSHLFTAALCALLLAFVQMEHPGKRYFRESFIKVSTSLRGFLDETRGFAQRLPPYRAVQITDFGPNREPPFAETLHFLHPGIDQFIPERVFFFTREALGILDGVGARDPGDPLWKNVFPSVQPPVRVKYTAKGFEVERD
ncbi:MAG TPA: hypothetical protein VIH99_12150 [Bdellovibrionota bacterium]